MRCIVQHATKWEWTGSSTLRMGKQLRQGKGWHYGTRRGACRVRAGGRVRVYVHRQTLDGLLTRRKEEKR